MPRARLELARYQVPGDFESPASTDSAIRAGWRNLRAPARGHNGAERYGIGALPSCARMSRNRCRSCPCSPSYCATCTGVMNVESCCASSCWIAKRCCCSVRACDMSCSHPPLIRAVPLCDLVAKLQADVALLEHERVTLPVDPRVDCAQLLHLRVVETEPLPHHLLGPRPELLLEHRSALTRRDLLLGRRSRAQTSLRLYAPGAASATPSSNVSTRLMRHRPSPALPESLAPAPLAARASMWSRSAMS